MRIEYPKQGDFSVRKGLLTVLLALLLGGCEEPSNSDGTVINGIVLPTDVVLNLFCPDVGIAGEPCVLEDPENPFALVPTFEFDVNNPPDAPSKFDLLENIPPGPTGAKARFYLWATALARRPSGENQWYTARALHELFDANSNPASKDEIVRAQALKAYRSVLDNFFGSVTVFEFGPQTLNEQVARDLFYTDTTGFERLVPLPLLNTIELFLEWNYVYDQELDLVTIVVF